MTFPNSFTPLHQSITTTLISGSGWTPNYYIPTGSLSLKTWYDGRPLEQLTADTNLIPQCKYTLTVNPSPKQWFQPSTTTLYDVFLNIDLAIRLQKKDVDSLRREAEWQINNLIPIIRRTFEYPNNLLTSSISGLSTGLASGRFQFLSSDTPAFQYNDKPIMSVGVTRLYFKGKCVLSNSLV